MIDAQNKFSHHLIIFLASFLFVIILAYSGIGFSRSVAAVSYIILCLILLIGPAVKIWPSVVKIPPKEFPWGVRGEMGIWFAVWSVIHVLFVFHGRDWDVIGYITGMSPWAFGAFVAVFMAIILAAISFRGAINFLGAEAWKWLQNYFTYVIFWLAIVHVAYDRAFLRPGFPSADFLHWTYLLMTFAVLILQIWGFIKTVQNKEQK